MAQLMLVNPRRRKRRATKTASRNPRRRRKMSALQRQYFGGGRRKTHRRRRRASASVASHNPRRRHRRISRRIARRNPRRGGLGGMGINVSSIKGIVLPAAIGGAGALALDAIWGSLPVPATWKVGTLAPFIKLAGVIGIGMLASKFLPRQRNLVKQAVGAAATIAAYNLIKAQVQARLPSLPLGEYVSGYISGTPNGSWSAQGNFPELGYVSPARQTGDMGGLMPWGNPEYQDQIF